MSETKNHGDQVEEDGNSYSMVRFIHILFLNFSKVLSSIKFYYFIKRQIVIRSRMIKLILFCFLIVSSISDCPLSPYPRKTIVGTIDVQLNNDPTLHNTALEYTYPLAQEFVDGNVNVAIAVAGYEFNSHQLIDFRVDFFLHTLFTALIFKAKFNDPLAGWRSLKFNFLATQSELYQIFPLSLPANSFSTSMGSGKYSLFRPIPTMPADPIIKVYINGLTLKAKPLDEQYNSMSRQFQNFKKFSATPSLVNSFSQAIEIKKALTFKLSQVKNIGKYLSLVLETTEQLQSLTVSCLIFSKKSLQEMHNYIQDTFSISKANQYKTMGLVNNGMLFIGLTGSRVSRDTNTELSISNVQLGGQLYFSLATNFAYLESTFTFVGFEIKTIYACRDCVDSPIIYDSKFCVQTCPRGFSLAQSNGVRFCDRCDIEKIKVVDVNTGMCVCAKRYFLDSGADVCRPCRYDCMTCTSSDKCLTCDNNLLQTKRKLNNAGFCECPSTGFYDERNAQNIICQKCDQSCLTCNGPKPHDCLTCSSNKELDANFFCVCKNGFLDDPSGGCYCPGQIANGICINDLPCGPNKQQQVVNSVRRCVCQPGFINVLNQCLKCGSNSVFDQSQAKCICIKGTIQVNGQCIGCGENKVYDEVYNRCICSNGSYKTDDGSCMTCPSKMVLIGGQCQCIYNYFQVSPGVCRTCLRETDGPNCKRNIL